MDGWVSGWIETNPLKTFLETKQIHSKSENKWLIWKQVGDKPHHVNEVQ